ncbi:MULTISPECIES: hypothetical protein [unclassified Fusibacter]|nr:MULTISPECIES: hypothetical protein [unclassified Fusibacter]MCK8059166.1 hypothetical protein [Fusibacter sp. A2]NPE22575.1 hypothetical protein [Fusibacter sp. A1]
MKRAAILLVIISAICIFPQILSNDNTQGQFAGKEDLPPHLSYSTVCNS